MWNSSQLITMQNHTHGKSYPFFTPKSYPVLTQVHHLIPAIAKTYLCEFELSALRTGTHAKLYSPSFHCNIDLI